MDIYQQLLQAVASGMRVVCIPGSRDGQPVMWVHATELPLETLPYAGHPDRTVRGWFALGHVIAARQAFADMGATVG
jgi:hypothetical protein